VEEPRSFAPKRKNQPTKPSLRGRSLCHNCTYGRYSLRGRSSILVRTFVDESAASAVMSSVALITATRNIYTCAAFLYSLLESL
jgi:hypothetical protein